MKIYLTASSGGLFNREDMTLCVHASIWERKTFTVLNGEKGTFTLFEEIPQGEHHFTETCYIYSCISCKTNKQTNNSDGKVSFIKS